MNRFLNQNKNETNSAKSGKKSKKLNLEKKSNDFDPNVIKLKRQKSIPGVKKRSIRISRRLSKGKTIEKPSNSPLPTVTVQISTLELNSMGLII